MHQDQRIGLALGVLLIGACAALFFRNETREPATTPRLQHAEELDSRIAERATKPYLTGVEAVEASDRARLKTVSDRGSTAESAEDHASSIWSPVESYGKNDAGQGRGRFGDTEGEVQELEPIPVPGDISAGADRSSGTELGDARKGADRLGSKSSEGAAEAQTHLVKQGETLSSIAARRLGNSNRFHEIYEANTDQLKDANDLRAGMILRIPADGSEGLAKGGISHSGSGSKEPTSISAERRSSAPRAEIDDTADGDAASRRNIHQPDVPSTLPPAEERPSGPRFVPARKFTPHARSIGPQAMLPYPIENIYMQ